MVPSLKARAAVALFFDTYHLGVIFDIVHRLDAHKRRPEIFFDCDMRQDDNRYLFR
jgi:hypothetical protein